MQVQKHNFREHSPYFIVIVIICKPSKPFLKGALFFGNPLYVTIFSTVLLCYACNFLITKI